MEQAYPYLPKGRTILYVSEDHPLMQEAARARQELSTDSAHPTGAVIVLNGAVLGSGANQSVFKNKMLRNLHKSGFCIRRLLKVPSGTRYWLCPGCASSQSHGEIQAVRDALSKNASLKGADLYLCGHWWCCKSCWDVMIAAGIKNVYLVEGATEKFSR